MEFSMEFNGISWNSINLSFIKFHGIPSNFPWIHGIHGITSNFPWNSMRKISQKNPSNVYEKLHRIPWKIP
jgi:hypothetical protein